MDETMEEKEEMQNNGANACEEPEEPEKKEMPEPRELEKDAPAEENAEGSSEDKKSRKEDKKEEKKYKAKAASLEKENAELKEKLDEETNSRLRIAAEYENFRKRTQKEKDGIYSDAVSDTVKELLPLFDDLDRAASYLGGDNVGEGLSLILKTVPDVLSKLKVEPFGEAGEQFDPNLHDAMMHEENEEYGENEIVEVFRKGYKTGEKIIRHALVKVAN